MAPAARLIFPRTGPAASPLRFTAGAVRSSKWAVMKPEPSTLHGFAVFEPPSQARFHTTRKPLGTVAVSVGRLNSPGSVQLLGVPCRQSAW